MEVVENEHATNEAATRLEPTLKEETPAAGTQTVTARPNPKLNTSPLHGLWALTERDLRKWYTNPYQLIISLIQPVIWMGLFGKALNFSSFITAGAATNGASVIAASASTSCTDATGVNATLCSFFGTTSYFSFLV